MTAIYRCTCQSCRRAVYHSWSASISAASDKAGVPTYQWRLQPDAVEGAMGAQVVMGRGRQESIQRTNLFTCPREFIQYARF